MYLVQILLPIADNSGKPIQNAEWQRVRRTLTRKFGGLTAFSRSPAEGVWGKSADAHRDDIVVLEVMTAELDRAWWRRYRTELEQRFQQQEVIIRADAIELL